ncbi:MAG TPA: sensor histidine kinase [Ruminococcaceae bacterium]|nr:sensor histidine kinase [Oscillospiraceae bacterium]
MRKALILFICVLLIGTSGILLLFGSDTSPELNVVAINDAVNAGLQNGDPNEAVSSLTQAVMEQTQSMDAARRGRDRGLQIFLFAYAGLMAAASILLYLYCNKRILRPFRKLRRFARDVASGNLDIPLSMDKDGTFGAFTESFDLMREELKRARENERNADRSKKELVASLSHDIKTPVASIKAATEFMLVTDRDDKDKRQLMRIGEKAEQINTLVTNMFHATLEDLQELSVTVSEIQSTVIPQLICSADYRGLVKPFEIPSCIVLCDMIRLQQIFDNILGNSYKYAGTDIEIRSVIDGRDLIIETIDSGSGVSGDELPLITGKFYRGKNAANQGGYGLGLYIADTLLSHMSGNLRCENRPEGFAAIVMLRLA